MRTDTIAGLRVVGTANELDEHGSTTTFYRTRSWTDDGADSSSLKTYSDFKRLHCALLASGHSPQPLPPCEQPLKTLGALDEYVRALSLDSAAVHAFLQPSCDDLPACGPTVRPRTSQPSSSSQGATTASTRPRSAPPLPPPPPLLQPLLAEQLTTETDGLLLCTCMARETAASERRRSGPGWVSQPLDASVEAASLLIAPAGQHASLASRASERGARAGSSGRSSSGRHGHGGTSEAEAEAEARLLVLSNTGMLLHCTAAAEESAEEISADLDLGSGRSREISGDLDLGSEPQRAVAPAPASSPRAAAVALHPAPQLQPVDAEAEVETEAEAEAGACGAAPRLGRCGGCTRLRWRTSCTHRRPW